MATLVPKPELEQVQVSNLQAIQRPVEQDYNLSDFTLGLMGLAKEGTDKYIEDNRQRLIALGASDYMNDYTRDVSILERNSYQQGQQYSTITKAQVQRRAEFSTRVREMAQNHATEGDIFDANKEFLQATVDDIYNSELDSDLKEGLYQEALKENLHYQKMIGENLQQVAVDDFHKTSRLLGADIIKELSATPMTPEQQNDWIQSRFNRIKIHAQASGVAKDDGEAHEIATNIVKGVFDGWFNSIDKNAPEASTALNSMRTLGENLYNAGNFDLASEMLGKVNTAQADVLNHNDDMLTRELELELHNMSVGDVEITPQQVTEKFNSLAMTGLYTDGTLNSLAKRYYTTLEEIEKRKLAGESELDALQYPDWQSFTYAGGTKDKWLSAVLQQTAKEVASENGGVVGHTAIANKLIYRANTSSTFMPELIDLAMNSATTELAQWARLSDEELKASGGYDSYKSSWDGLVKQYQLLPASAKETMLASIDDKHFPNKEVLRGLLETGAPLNSMRKAMDDPLGMARKLELADKAINSLNIESAKLDRFWTTGRNGTWFNRMHENVRESSLETQRTHALRYKGLLASQMSSGSASNLSEAMERSNLMITGKYSPTYIDPQIGAMINSGRLTGSDGKVVGKDYVARAIDAQREVLAKNSGGRVKAEDILVTQSGNALYFTMHDKDGNLTNSTGTFGQQGASVSLTDIVHNATNIRSHEAKTAQAKVQQVRVPKTVITGGMSTGDGIVNVRSNAKIGQGTVSLYNKGGKVVPVNYPASLAVPFGNNLGIATEVINHWANHEGFVDAPYLSKATKGTTSTSSWVIGWGITKQNHPKTFELMTKATSVQQQMDLQSAFMGQYFKQFDLLGKAKSLGLPAPTTAPYPQKYVGTYVLLADAIWHGGGAGGNAVVNALKQPTEADAIKYFKTTKLYKALKPEHRRNVWNIQQIQNFYRSKQPQVPISTYGVNFNPPKYTLRSN